MAIYIKSSPPAAPQMPDIDLLTVAGLFGSLSAGPMEAVTNFNTALMGFMRCTDEVPHAPISSWPWGMVWTISTKGTGPTGKRCIPAVLEQGEVTHQFFYTTQGALYSRGGIWLTGWGDWQMRWDKT